MQRNKFPIFRWVAITLIFLTIMLTTIQLVNYSRIRNNFPLGMHVGRVPIGGLDYVRAAERLYTVYRSPIELNYEGNVIHIRPAVLGFEPEVDQMLAVADNQRMTEPFWEGFWNFLWDRNIETITIPLNASYDEPRIRDYLQQEIGWRYDSPATPPKPIPGTTQYAQGIPGTTLDVERATMQVIDAFKSPINRRVTLSMEQTSIPRASMGDLEIMLEQIIELSGFDGVVEIFLQDLASPRNLMLAYQQNNSEIDPEIAFSSWSLVKIPLMVTAFRYMEEPYPPAYMGLLTEMIQQSENTSTDELAMLVIDNNLSPLIVTEDMRRLGLTNSFWAGHFYPGAPLLQRFETPANQRNDVITNPDIYNQTTAADMGMLMEDIYHCAENGGGAILAAFPGEITQEECQIMVTYLARNQIGVLLQAGVPADATVAHKHGWATESDGLTRTMGNSAIIYTPGGDYSLTVFVYHPVQTVFEPVNRLFAEISQAIYNFYNN